MKISLQTLKEAVDGTAAAFRCVTDYQPAGGPGDKVFPSTYEGGRYATEQRIGPDGEIRDCVLLDSVQSQANRMESALLEECRAGNLELPLLVTRFDQPELLKKFTLTSLEAPHRIADAIFRDSLLDGKVFRKSSKGAMLDNAEVRNSAGLFGLCPTALVFGLWDSTGPRGGLGAKFQRAIVSEIVGYDAVPGVKTASRLDPLGIERRAGPVYRTGNGDWTLDPDKAEKEKGKPVLFRLRQGKKVTHDPDPGKDIPDQGRPSVINHGNVTPDYDFAMGNNRQVLYETKMDERGNEVRVRPRILGGFSISKATQTTVLSLPALRRLRFPLNGAADSEQDVDVAARTTLVALGLAAGTLARNDGDLRSRCQLFAVQVPVWELLDRPGETPKQFECDSETALSILREAIAEAREVGLPWEGEIALTPSQELVELVRRSQKLASASPEESS